MRTHSFSKYLLASVFCHLGYAIYLLWEVPPERPLDVKATEVELAIAINEKEKDKSPKSVKVPEQLVDTDPDLLPYDEGDDADFLGEKDQRVDVETVAQKIAQFKNDAGDKQPSKDPAEDLDPDLIPDSEEGLAAKSDSSRPDADSLLGQSSGVNSSDDNIKGKQLGMKTLLNTKGYVYFSYYKLIKSQISKHWEARIKQKLVQLLSADRSLAAQRDPVTRLFIIINRDGQLSGVQILQASGTHELDQAAVEAFKEAAPFPVPPQGIVDSDGNVKIRWDFALQARSGD
ncbi:MAG: TonB family protein [Bdellovibrionales bacterium]|nr:TonB family protein [Bdellovibrionales bacterium]